MIIFGCCVRVANVETRFYRSILFKISPNTIAGSSEADDGDADVDPAYAELRQYVVLQDRDTLPSADPRIHYSLDVTRAAERRPFTLDSSEAALQQEPLSNKFAKAPDAQAFVYNLNEIVGMRRIVNSPVGVTMVANCLPPQSRRAFQSYENRRKRRVGDERTYDSLAAVDAALRECPAIGAHARRCAVATLSEAFSGKITLELSAALMAAVESAARLSAVEADRLMGFVQEMVSAHQDDDDSSKPPHPWDFPMLRAAAACAFCDALPLSSVGTRRRMRLQTCVNRRMQEDALLKAHMDVMNYVRSSSSTVARLNYAQPLKGDFYDILRSLKAFEVVGHTDNASGERVPLVMTGRDWALERDLARLVREAADWTLLTVQSHAVDAYDVLVERMEAMALVDRRHSTCLFVAPTAAHAQLMPFDCVAVDDVVHGTLPTFAYDRVCLVMAHAMGLDSVVHCVRLVNERHVVMVGDPLNVDGSPRESDRGAPLRDLCAAARRHWVDVLRMEHLVGFANERRAGALDSDQWRDLRQRDTADAAWPTANRWSRYESMDDVPAAVRQASGALVLVGVASTYRALQVTGQKAVDHFVVRSHIVIDELGQVARVATPHVVETLGDAVAQPVDPKLVQTKDCAHVQTRSLYLIVDSAAVDHRQCCMTKRANHVMVAMHPTLSAASAVAVRRLARVAQRPIADELVFVVDETTGIEDVRAAFSLVRDHLHVVGSYEAVYSAVARHSSRPRTNLVDLLKPDAVVAAGAMSLLYDERVDEAVSRVDAPYTALLMGSLCKSAPTRDVVGATRDGRVLVPQDALRRHTDCFLTDDNSLDDRARSEPASAVFSRQWLTDRVMADITREKLDSEIMWRLWTLADSHTAGRLGADQEEQYVAERAASYVQRERRPALEAMAVHALALVCKRRHTEWMHRAEKALAQRLWAAQPALVAEHATAVRQHLDSVAPLPDGDDEADDECDLFAKLREVRAYVEKSLDQ